MTPEQVAKFDRLIMLNQDAKQTHVQAKFAPDMRHDELAKARTAKFVAALSELSDEEMALFQAYRKGTAA